MNQRLLSALRPYFGATQNLEDIVTKLEKGGAQDLPDKFPPDTSMVDVMQLNYSLQV